MQKKKPLFAFAVKLIILLQQQTYEVETGKP
jgi:hypothetical protein